MQLTADETNLVEVFRRLPANAADELSALILRLSALAPVGQVDWSEAWSEEDLKDFRAASIKRLDKACVGKAFAS